MKKYLTVCTLAATLVSCVGHEDEFARSLAVKGFADLVLMNGKIVTLDENFSLKEAVAVKDGKIAAVGGDGEMRRWTGSHTQVINLNGRTVIPGLNDSHIHATAGCINWETELHWEYVKSLAEGLTQIREAALDRPAGSWIVVGGGWVPTQFAERRFPTRADLDAVAPKHPVYVQYMREGALLNNAALIAAGINRQTPDPPGGKFERNPATGELTGMLQGEAAWDFVYGKIPPPTLDQAHQSLLRCFRELNRLGLTSVGDFQTHEVTFAHRRLLGEMARKSDLTLRINYYIAPNEAGDELEELRRTTEEVKKLSKSDLFRFAGFGEVLIRGTGDGDLPSAPDGFTIDPQAREKFRRLIRFFAEAGHNFHLHAAQDHTARQLLDVIEEVEGEAPFLRQRITFAHLEDASPETLLRIVRLGGGISVQDRMALTGERNVQLWGSARARNAPPLRTMIQSRVPLGAGTDGFRSGRYSPMLSLWWLITGKTVSGTAIRDPKQNVTREEALRMYTLGSAWFTFDETNKGSIEVGKLADLAVLNGDYLTVPEDQIRSLESLLTVVGGRIVYAASPFTQLEGR
jgi:predicted amidohydrolase YtcJ